jgi:protein involved in polysaccharide export with SLBB domain
MAAEDDTTNLPSARLHIGDTVSISLSGLPNPIADSVKIINDNGTIDMDVIGSVKAAGETPGELADEIHDAYVPKYYTHVDVSVTPGDRVFYVQGAVGQPGRQIYVGQITVTKAIASAGDFTDFANKRNVILTRANGKRFKINCDAILSGDRPDPPVFPGDQIVVERRLY